MEKKKNLKNKIHLMKKLKDIFQFQNYIHVSKCVNYVIDQDKFLKGVSEFLSFFLLFSLFVTKFMRVSNFLSISENSNSHHTLIWNPDEN